jgi:hypothetical protein
VSDTDGRPGPQPDTRGFSTRAIRAASRVPKLEQTPTTRGLLRVSVGLEDLEDLQADFAAALAAAATTRGGRPVPALGAV